VNVENIGTVAADPELPTESLLGVRGVALVPAGIGGGVSSAQTAIIEQVPQWLLELRGAGGWAPGSRPTGPWSPGRAGGGAWHG